MSAHDEAAAIGRYVRAIVRTQVLHMGAGCYGLVAKWSDGSRVLEYVGFATAEDAARFAAFQGAVEDHQPVDPLAPAPEPTTPIVAAHVAHVLASIGLTVVAQAPPGATRCGYDTVILSLIVPEIPFAVAREPQEGSHARR
ncbi:MAG: hypothetical protein ABSD03_14860 [Vulcanimicrobiaceae bacterium]|jgi:hypothetical protein